MFIFDIDRFKHSYTPFKHFTNLILGYSNYDQHQWANQHQQQAVSQGVVTDGASEGTDQTDSASQSHAFQQQG